MADTTRLQVGIDAKGAQQGAQQTSDALKQIDTAANKTNQTIGDMEKKGGAAVSALGDRFDKLKEKVFSIQGAIAGLGFGALLHKIVETNVEFQRLEANLKTVTGSVMGARAAFSELQKFAASTPFSLRGLTDAFTTLKLAGVDTSARALTAFGNISASFGKDITELAIAVKSAMAGEMEALSTFGPKVLVEGDKFVVAFQGKTQKIERSAYALQQYLINLGETRFAGGMANQMDTLAGQWSNFGDNIDRLFSQIGKGGLNDALKELLEWLNKITSTGDEAARSLGETLGNALRILTAAIQFVYENWELLFNLFKAWAAANFVILLVDVASALFSAAKAMMLLNVAMVSNPFTLLAAAVAAVIAYLIDLSDWLGFTDEATKRWNESTEKVMKELRNADKSNLNNTLANVTAIADEMERTNGELGKAGVNTEAWARKMMALKALQQENLQAALEFIRDMSEQAVEKAVAQDFKDPKDELSLEEQLAAARKERYEAEKKLTELHVGAKGALSLKETGVEVQEGYGGGVTLTTKRAVEFDKEGVEKMGQEAIAAMGDLDRAMTKVDEIQAKIDSASKKASDKASKKASDDFQKGIEKMTEGLEKLEQQAVSARSDLELAMEFGDSNEAEKRMMFAEQYLKLTKDGTLPMTKEEEAWLRKSVDDIVDLKQERESLLDAQKEQKKIQDSIKSAQVELSILNNKDIKDKDLAVELAEYEADLIRDKVSNVADLVRQKKQELEIEKDLKATKSFDENVADLDKQIKAKKEELDLMQETTKEKFIQKELSKSIEKAEKENRTLNADQLDLIREKAGELYRITEEIEKQEKAQKKQLKVLSDFLKEGSFESTMENLAKMGVDAIDQLSDAFVEFIFTGQQSFAEFFQSLAKDIAKLIIKLLVAQAIAAAINALVPGAGTAAVSIGGGIAASVKHAGGYSTTIDQLRTVPVSSFIGAKPYKMGGIPGIANNEIPTILHDREAVVPLPNGRSIPVDLKGEGSRTENHYHTWMLPGVTNAEEFRKTVRQQENEFNARMKKNKRR